MPPRAAFSSTTQGSTRLFPRCGSLRAVGSDFLPTYLLSLASEGTSASLSATGPDVVDFSPVLNVPALSSFLVISGIFLFLQLRIRSIGKAADQRTEALGELRSMKARELAGKASPVEVEHALENYREAYDRVESLRDVVPGARIAPPPSQSLSRERMEDNVAGARQFLGVETESTSQNDSDDTEKSLPLPLTLLLAVVAASQIGVLVLLSIDPVTNKTW